MNRNEVNLNYLHKRKILQLLSFETQFKIEYFGRITATEKCLEFTLAASFVRNGLASQGLSGIVSRREAVKSVPCRSSAVVTKSAGILKVAQVHDRTNGSYRTNAHK